MFFSGTLTFSMIQFDFWVLCHSYQLEHLEFLGSRTVEAWLGEFWALFASMWDECKCAVVWAFFCIAFLWDWNENRPFPVLRPLLSFPNLLAYWVQHFHSIIFQDCSVAVRQAGSLGSGGQEFESPKKTMPKNAQTTTQLHSSHTLAK